MIRRIRRLREEPRSGDVDVVHPGRDEPHTDPRSEQPGDADVSPASGDGFGDLRESRTNRWKVEQR